MTPPAWLGRSLDRRENVVSTMDECTAALRAGAPDGHVVVARRQSGGRGRTGRAWHSADEGGLYLSFVLRGFDSAAAASGLTLSVGVGALDAVRALGVERATLKWPNDVVVDGRKLAGILTSWVDGETPASSGAVVGIGLNVAQASFPDKLAPIASSVAIETGRAREPGAVLSELLASVEAAVDSFRRDGLAWVVPAWSSRSDLWGRRARAAGWRLAACAGRRAGRSRRRRGAVPVTTRWRSVERALIPGCAMGSGAPAESTRASPRIDVALEWPVPLAGLPMAPLGGLFG